MRLLLLPLLLLCHCQVIAMLLPWCCHVIAILLPSFDCHVSAMLSPWYCCVIGMTSKRLSHKIAALSTSCAVSAMVYLGKYVCMSLRHRGCHRGARTRRLPGRPQFPPHHRWTVLSEGPVQRLGVSRRMCDRWLGNVWVTKWLDSLETCACMSACVCLFSLVAPSIFNTVIIFQKLSTIVLNCSKLCIIVYNFT